VRRFASNPGYAVNVEQEVADGLGVFARLSQNGGSKEAYEFTEINRSVSAGMALTGNRWNRPNDQVGVAGVVNALSDDARAYLGAGGMGILIGDGRLNYGKEQIAEAYYSFQVCPIVKLSLDYQHVTNPGYNRDRGPVTLYALRLHAEM
jgi:high affinity Mn2+ porin